MLALARHGGELSETMPVELESIARIAWSSVDTDDASLDVVDSTPIEADRDQFVRLLENLFRNAIEHGAGTDASGSGTATQRGTDVTVTVGMLADGEGFYVADDGPGLPAELRDRVFEPGVTSRDDGTGLGLAIVADIATAHGWTVELDDEDGGGTRFEFSIEE